MNTARAHTQSILDLAKNAKRQRKALAETESRNRTASIKFAVGSALSLLVEFYNSSLTLLIISL